MFIKKLICVTSTTLSLLFESQVCMNITVRNLDKKQSLVDMLGSKDYSRFCDDGNHINPRQSRFRGSLNDYMETLIILACEPHVNAASICNSLNLFMFYVDFSRNTLHIFA